MSATERDRRMAQARLLGNSWLAQASPAQITDALETGADINMRSAERSVFRPRHTAPDRQSEQHGGSRSRFHDLGTTKE